ncbi:MAG: hypothetical protein SOI26_02065 [Coriobacteriales bacterium]
MATRVAARTYHARQAIDGLWRRVRSGLRACGASIARRPLSWMLAAVGFVWIAYVCVPQALQGYGYGASDTVVHNYWINGLIDNDPFVAGVYPMGFHCVIYFLHELTGIPVYVYLRLIGVVMMFELVGVLFATLRLACRSAFAPFVGVVAFVGVDLVTPLVGSGGTDLYWRILAGLPQEYSMMFILPAAWFAISYLRDRSARGDRGRRTLGPDGNPLGPRDWARRALRLDLPATTWKLVGFSCSLALTVSIHFYSTIILALVLAGVVVSYLLTVLRPRVLGAALAASALGLALAVWPMAVALAGGTPLQGSLSWGLQVMSSSSASADSGQTADSASDGADGSAGALAPGLSASDGASSARPATLGDGAGDGASGATVALASSTTTGVTGAQAVRSVAGGDLLESLRGTARQVANTLTAGASVLSVYLMSYCYAKMGFGVAHAVPATVALLLGVGVLMLAFKRQRDAGHAAIACSVAMLVMLAALISDILGLPRLMNSDRMGMFIVYLMPTVPALLVDVAAGLVAGWFKGHAALDVASLAIGFALSLAGLVAYGPMPPVSVDKQEYNGNIVCLTAIMRQLDPGSWTIVSANDELRMSEDYGYHTEIADLLAANEYGLDDDGDIETRLEPYQIPTQHVFFFCEKYVTYSVQGQGAWVSPQAACAALPDTKDIGVYKDQKRLVEMARMFYWLQELRRRYPLEVHVFYEDDEFVCYELDQPASSPLNLAFDYGYNGYSALAAQADASQDGERWQSGSSEADQSAAGEA